MITNPITDADFELDLSDAWAELTDPERARDEVATALFDVTSETDSHFAPRGHGEFSERDFTTYSASFRGLRIENGTAPIYISREWCITAFGIKWIAEVEEIAAEKAQWERAA